MIKFSVKHPVTILMFIGVLLVLGVVSLSRMGLDLLPQLTYPAVTVVTRYENVAPEDIEQLITKPIERVVSTVSGVKKVTSQSIEGVSVVIVEFEWGTNLDFAAQEVRDKIGLIERYLPADVQKPIVFKFDASMMPVARYIVTSDRYSLTQLKKLLEDDIKPFLERVEGVATVDVMGGREIEYWVEVDIPKLLEGGVSFNQISQMLQLNNFNFPSGKVDVRHKTLLIRTVGEYSSIRDLENQVVGFRKNGLPVFLKDVAKIYVTESERLGFAKSFKDEAVMVSVYKRSGANTVQVVRRVDKAVARISQWYKDVKLQKGFDQARFITKSASETINTGIIGAILAAIMIFLFLIDLRPTLVISLAIPLSVIISFTVLYFLGYSLNMMTLAGIALGVGMLVDAAVVVVENIFRHEEQGEERYIAAINGAEEVWTAISASTLTNIVVFLPLIYIGGMIGQFTKPMAITVAVTLLASLLVAVTIIPVMTSSYITQAVALKEMRKRYWFTPLRDFYHRLLTQFVLPKRGIVLILTIVLFIVSIPILKFIDREFMPSMDMGTAIISVELPPATSLQETEHYVDQLIDIAEEYPEVERVMAIGGLSSGMIFGTSQGSNTATLMIRLVDAAKRKKSSMQVANEILQKAPIYEGATVKSMDLVNTLFFGGAGKPVEVSLYGNDLEELLSLANRVADEIGKIKGISGIELSFKKAKPELRINILRDKAAYFGLTPIQIQRELQIAFQGVTTTKLRLRGKDYDLVLKADTTYLKENVEKLYYFPIITPMGAVIPLKEIAEFSYDFGAVQIDRENQSRVIKVLADIRGRKKSEVFSEIRDRLFKLSLPEGYSLQIKGELEQVQDMIKNLGISIFAAILLVYMILAAQLESLKDPIIIMLTIPLAFVGIIWALFITGTTISVPSMVGALILVGVVVNQAIVMLTFYKELREKGVGPLEAVIEGSVTRLRPVLITNLTTIFGLIPMALSGHTEGGALRQPLAVSMIGGLVTSTIMTFLVVPVIYTYFEKIKTK